jgi:hypothetical protein
MHEPLPVRLYFREKFAGIENGETMELEALWEHILSEKTARIRPAWESLDDEGRDAVKRHLQTMARDAGWHPNQRHAAAAALQWIEELEEK